MKGSQDRNLAEKSRREGGTEAETVESVLVGWLLMGCSAASLNTCSQWSGLPRQSLIKEMAHSSPQYNLTEANLSIKVSSSQMTLAYIKLTTKGKKKLLSTHVFKAQPWFGVVQTFIVLRAWWCSIVSFVLMILSLLCGCGATHCLALNSLCSEGWPWPVILCFSVPSAGMMACATMPWLSII